MAIGTQIGFAIGGFIPTVAAAIAGQGSGGWVPVAALVLGLSVLAAIAIATARETHLMSLPELDRQLDRSYPPARRREGRAPVATLPRERPVSE